MKYILIIVIILFCLNPVFSQKDTSKFYNKTLSKNNFSIELGGKALFYSLGYERIVYRSEKVLLTGNINLSYVPFAGFDGIVIPITINTLIGKKRNKLLFGLSVTNAIDFNPYPKTRKARLAYIASGQYKYDHYSPPYQLLYLVPNIGYRMYFKTGSSFSLAFAPIVYHHYNYIDLSNLKLGLFPWFSINYNFKL